MPYYLGDRTGNDGIPKPPTACSYSTRIGGPRDAQPLVFHHGWPLTADEWDNQLLFFLSKGYRVIAHDRRGHGRSSQTDTGNDMDTYAADVAALVAALNLKGAVHIGHSTGGGEAAHYAARAKPGTLSKLVLVAAVPPVMVKKPGNSGGLSIDVFDGFRKSLAEDRSQFYLDIPACRSSQRTTENCASEADRA
jgi:non-heme chloroperoxidase